MEFNISYVARPTELCMISSFFQMCRKYLLEKNPSKFLQVSLKKLEILLQKSESRCIFIALHKNTIKLDQILQFKINTLNG